MEEKIYESTRGEILITQASRNLLETISKWTKFLAILGFICLGLGVVFILSSGLLIDGINRYMAMSDSPYYRPGVFSWIYAVVYLIVLLVYFFPVYFLHKFSVRIQKALRTNETSVLTEAFNSLKNHYVYIGVITIIGLVFLLISCIMMFTAFAGAW